MYNIMEKVRRNQGESGGTILDMRFFFMRKDGGKQKRRRICRGIALLLACSVLVSGCSLPGKKQNNTYVPSEVPIPTDDGQPGMSEEDALYAALDYMETMSLEEKVGQIFIVNLELLDGTHGNFYEHQKITRQMKETLQQFPVGGVIFFSRNIAKRKQTKQLIRRLQKNSDTPLFVTVDEEGGDVARIGSNEDMKTTTFPTMEHIGKKKDADYVYDMAVTIGKEIGELGFNVDFAPVADVRTSELNREIGSRSFGDNPKMVSRMVSAYVQGLKSQNICSTLKHFPGQGSSKGDTHQGSVDIDSSIAGLRKIDFKPFEAGIDAGADFIMVSHISVSRVTETSEPASVSELIMTTILREELEFKGIIITDAFDMASITKDYTAGEAAWESFQAGADIILMPQDLEEAFQAIFEKVQTEPEQQKRLDDSVLRILQLKFQKGIMTLEDLKQDQQKDGETAKAATSAALP